ncbi:MAG: hypothetical protein BJ554DRAFT_5163, partial [Olpidium bornovanus]
LQAQRLELGLELRVLLPERRRPPRALLPDLVQPPVALPGQRCDQLLLHVLRPRLHSLQLDHEPVDDLLVRDVDLGGAVDYHVKRIAALFSQPVAGVKHGRVVGRTGPGAAAAAGAGAPRPIHHRRRRRPRPGRLRTAGRTAAVGSCELRPRLVQ